MFISKGRMVQSQINRPSKPPNLSRSANGTILTKTYGAKKRFNSANTLGAKTEEKDTR